MVEVNKVCVIGLGYIGLPTAALLARSGFDVIGVDTNKKAVEMVNSGVPHLVEPRLDEYVSDAVSSGKLIAQQTPEASDAYIICVPTPLYHANGDPKPNLTFVENAVRSISPYLEPGNLVILESTSPVGTTDMLVDTLLENHASVEDFNIAYCPERVLPGRILIELVENARVVGGTKPESTRVVANFYRKFVRGDVVETDAATAEMCKLTENSYRDVCIAFANELSMLCEKAGVDVWELISIANRHPRVNILKPGPGVGGHCIAVDPWFLIANDVDNSKLIRQARHVNSYKTEWVIKRVVNSASKIGKSKSNTKIAVLGLTFKPDVDDVRESPALFVVQGLKKAGYERIVAVEPNIKQYSDIEITELHSALKGVDVVVVLVAHSKFQEPEFIDLLSRQACVLDFCGLTSSAV